jgi:hypothetical protein
MEKLGRHSNDILSRLESKSEGDRSGRYLIVGLAVVTIVLLIALTGCSQPETQADSKVATETNHQGNAESGSESGEGKETPGDLSDGEESGQQFGLTDTYDRVRAGARLELDYDQSANAFVGQVENVTDTTLKRVRVEVHLSNGIELGPTDPVDLSPGQTSAITLRATSQPFATWSAHPEVGQGGESGEHSNGSEHNEGIESGEHSRSPESGIHDVQSENSTIRASSTEGIARAADASNSTLSEKQLATAIYAFDDPVRSNWSNLPAGMLDYQRNGVRIGELSAQQVEAMQEFLATALSPIGYSTIIGIVGAEGELEESPRADRMQWDDENYWLAFFGKPSDEGQWGWQFGGRNLAVNVTAVGGGSYISPTFPGIEPAKYEDYGVIVEPLARHVVAGLAVIQSLESDLQSSVTTADRPRETLVGAGKDGVIRDLEGSPARDWTDGQRAKLLDAISFWTGLLPEDDSAVRLDEIKAELNDVYFAWNGEVDGNGAIYYRVQGPSLIIEFSTQGNLGSDGGTITPFIKIQPMNMARE